MDDKALNKLDAALVGTMAEATPPPPEGMVTKFAEALASLMTPEQYRQMAKECEESGKDISLEIARFLINLPRSERKRISKSFGIPWEYLNRR